MGNGRPSSRAKEGKELLRPSWQWRKLYKASLVQPFCPAKNNIQPHISLESKKATIFFTESAMIGAKIAPIRPLVEHSPTAVLLITVGKSSELIVYAEAAADEMNSFPTSANPVRSPGISFETSPVTRQATPLSKRLPLREGLLPNLSITKIAPKEAGNSTNLSKY